MECPAHSARPTENKPPIAISLINFILVLKYYTFTERAFRPLSCSVGRPRPRAAGKARSVHHARGCSLKIGRGRPTLHIPVFWPGTANTTYPDIYSFSYNLRWRIADNNGGRLLFPSSPVIVHLFSFHTLSDKPYRDCQFIKIFDSTPAGVPAYN